MKKISLFLFVALYGNISFGQTITTIAGTGTPGYSGDGGAATAALLHNPGHLAADVHGNLFFTDYYNNVIRRIDAAGVITTIAGTNVYGYTGDGGPATLAKIYAPNAIDIDPAGNLYFADQGNNAIRKISVSGIISTVAGTGTAGYTGDGIAATASEINQPDGVGVDGSGNIYIADTYNDRVRKVDAAGIITTIAGIGVSGFSSDGIPATASQVKGPVAVTTDNAGNVYIADQFNQRIRKIDTAGIITTIAGTGTMGFSGDGGSARAAELYYPSDVKVSPSGFVYFDDSYNNRIRMIDGDGIIYTIAGNGSTGYYGDGGPATSAHLSQPWGIDFNICGDLFIADAENNAVRQVNYFTGMPSITGSSSLRVGSATTLGITAVSGTWSSSSPTLATVTSTGVVTGISTGIDTITYTNMCGSSFLVVTVSATSTNVANINTGIILSLAPNPNTGMFLLTCQFENTNTIINEVKIEITDLLGRVVLRDVAPVNNGTMSKEMRLDASVPNGTYLVRLNTANNSKVIRFTLNR